MKKRLLLLAAFAVMLIVAQAQTTSHQPDDDISFNGYTIHLLKNSSGGFSWDIISKGKVLIHQVNNPFNGSSDGLTNREDAIKVAKWQAIHINPATGQSIVRTQQLPIEVARQLKITVE